MRYNDDADLDTSEVTDARSSSGAGGGGGMAAGLLPVLLSVLFRGKTGKAGWALILVAAIAYVAFNYFSSDSGSSSGVLDRLGDKGQSGQADNTELAKECKTGADANDKLECAIVADINSIQDYWAGGGYATVSSGVRRAADRYTNVDTTFFKGSVSTACGSADSNAGPFYCPADDLVYIDLSFYEQLKSQFGAEGGPLVNAYVLAHEYGHHVQDLLGTKVQSGQGADSDSVRLELQADCYAGVWMNHATQPQDGQPALITDITQGDLDSAVDAAGRIGDDYIQGKLGGGSVDPDSFTHGTSTQRKKWLTTGYRGGDPRRCDTFATNDLG